MKDLIKSLEKLLWGEYKEKGYSYSDGRQNGIKKAIALVKAWQEKHGVTKHECSFGFEDVGKKGIYEPEKGQRGFSTKREDWVCRCGMTRREYLGKIDKIRKLKALTRGDGG